MPSPIETLFQLTRSQISQRHIIDFSPGDPGYESYVREWTRIFRTGEVPHKSHFDLSEVINLTGWALIRDTEVGIRFRQYRRFTSAVAVALIESGNDSESVRVANYLTHDLVVDTDLKDREHFNAVRHALPVVRQILMQAGDEAEFPFLTLASLVMAHQAGDSAVMPSLASQLIEDENTVRTNERLNWHVEDSRFLFGLTSFDRLNGGWLRLTSTLTNPTNDFDLQLVIDLLNRQRKATRQMRPGS